MDLEDDLSMIHSYLIDRTKKAVINGFQSNLKHLLRGVLFKEVC